MSALTDSLRTLPVLTRYRSGVLAATDGAAWTVAIAAATLARYDLAPAEVSWIDVAWFAFVAAGLQTLVGTATGLYRDKRRLGSFDEVALLAANCASVTLVLLFATLAITPRPLAIGAVLLGGVLALAAMGGFRWCWRRWNEAHRRPDPTQGQRLVVLGAGRAAERVLTSMLTDPDSRFVPVALWDDDPAKANLRVRGVPVRGTRADLLDVLEDYGANAVLVAIARADRDLLREVHAAASAVEASVLVLPPISESLERPAGAADVRPLDETDPLDRQTVDTDIDQIAGYIADKRVILTGAGGSIGSELTRQVARLGPAQLLLANRDESALADVQLSLCGSGALDSPDVVLCDVRDRERMLEVFKAHRPHVVFHAAALKHVPALEAHPHEAVKTNVDGTAHVLEAARSVAVERSVNISTDKDANPVNVLGTTKRIAERLTAEAAAGTDGVYVSVRFGNVIGNRGSVLEVFRAQAAAGGPITVTHRDITRYFMTVGEAVQLVIQAAIIGADGEVLLLDMGESVAIAEIAAQVAEEHGEDVAITYTGLRAGEKLHEQLFATGETGITLHHPLINHVPVPSIEWSQVRATIAHSNGHLPDALRELVATDLDQVTQVRELARGGDDLSSRIDAQPSL